MSEVGVSATTITWGFMLLDVGATRGIPGAAVVGIDPEQQRRAIRIYVDDINNRGGINGRTVDAVFVNADATTEDDQRAGCLELTQDHKVFAVVANGGLYPSALSCVTRENGTPLLTDGGRGTPTELYHQSGGLLFTLHQAGTRLMTNWVARLDELGALGARKIGVVSDEGNDPGDRMVGGGLIPALKQFGHEVTHRTRLQADVSVAASQIPLEVQQMRAKGVNTVFLATQARNAAQFVGEAQAQQWSPAWMATDYANVCSDVTGGTMTANFDGAICVSATRIGDWRVGHPEPPDDARCRVQYEKATGEALPRNNGNSSNTTYTITIAFCGLMRILETAAQEAGAELTRPRLSAAMQRLGAIALPNMGGGSFAGGKFDAADVARTVRYRTSCRCWTPDGDFHRSRF